MSTTTENLQALSIADIARRIRTDWNGIGKGVNYAAAPYLDAMDCMHDVSDQYGADSGKHIVRYFLSNASSYRGDTARALKVELKRRIG